MKNEHRYFTIDGEKVKGFDLISTDLWKKLSPREELIWKYGENYDVTMNDDGSFRRATEMEFQERMILLYAMDRRIELTEAEKRILAMVIKQMSFQKAKRTQNIIEQHKRKSGEME
jgi:hypothetical protein